MNHTLTTRQAAFVEHRLRGATNADAAVQAGYAERSASEAGARLARHPKVIAELAMRRGQAHDAGDAVDDPKAYLLTAMNDAKLDLRLRMEAAKALLPYMHQKMGEGGKKDAAAAAAKKASTPASRFSPAKPPGNVISLRNKE